MFPSVTVDELHHRRKSCRLSLSDWSHHKKKSLLHSSKHFKYRREIELADCLDLCWNGAKCNTDCVLLIKSASSKTTFVVKIIREVNLPVCKKTLLEIWRDDLSQHPHCV